MFLVIMWPKSVVDTDKSVLTVLDYLPIYTRLNAIEWSLKTIGHTPNILIRNKNVKAEEKHNK